MQAKQRSTFDNDDLNLQAMLVSATGFNDGPNRLKRLMFSSSGDAGVRLSRSRLKRALGSGSTKRKSELILPRPLLTVSYWLSLIDKGDPYAALQELSAAHDPPQL